MSRASLIDTLRSKLAAVRGGPLAVGFSGGMDSTALLQALSQIPATRERGLRAIHIDHGLNPDSARWSEHCSAVAASMDIPIVIERATVSLQGEGLEAAARDARYDRFRHLMRDGEIIALAHHADDQAETILLKLLRGAGPEGLGGMRAMRALASGFIWRPLLDVPRKSLAEYAQREQLTWIDDPANTDTRLRRNFLRHEIIPRLAERWPDTSVALAHSAAWARAAADHIDGESHVELEKIRGGKSNTLHWRAWLNLSDALRDATLRHWLRELTLPPPAFFHVAEIERQLRDAAPDRSPCVRWPGCEIRRYRDFMYAMPPLPPQHEWEVVWDGSEIELPDGSLLALRNGDATVRFSKPMIVRNRRGGERIRPVGGAHHRDVRLLLQESGVPPWMRTHLPLIYDDDDLIGVADIALTDLAADLLAKMNARIVWTSRPPSRNVRTIDSFASLR